MESSDLRITALAICTQFQVTRKSIPCTAAIAICAASVAALRGILPEIRIPEQRDQRQRTRGGWQHVGYRLSGQGEFRGGRRGDHGSSFHRFSGRLNRHDGHRFKLRDHGGGDRFFHFQRNLGCRKEYRRVGLYG
jgi:hypothetical protein